MSYNRSDISDLERIAMAVRFKEYLLNRDIDSRREILTASIAFLAKNDAKPNVLTWFRNIETINNGLDPKERKEAVRFDAYWHEFYSQIAGEPNVAALMHCLMDRRGMGSMFSLTN